MPFQWFLSLTLALVGAAFAGSAQGEPASWEEYSDLGIKPNTPRDGEGEKKPDLSAVPGSAINQEHSLTLDEEELLDRWGEDAQGQDSITLERMWEQKGYGRPVKPGEKEGASQSALRESAVQDEMRRLRESGY